MAIVELRAARGWSLENTARVFFVTAATVASWIKRIDEQGRDALLQLPEPVNRFPDFIRYAVQRLKVLCPTMGQVKIAQTLARAGQHLGPTTVGRILKEKSKPTPKLPVTSSTALPRCHFQISKPRLECGSHDGSRGSRFLVFVDSPCLTTALAILWVGRGCHRSLFPPRDGHGPVQERTQ